MSGGASDANSEARPIYLYVAAAQTANVSKDAAWSMWRAVFTYSTRKVFRSVWDDVAGSSPGVADAKEET